MKLDDVEQFMFLIGVQTYVVLWLDVDSVSVRWNGRNLKLAAVDVMAKLGR